MSSLWWKVETGGGWFCRFSCGQKLGVGVSSTSSFKVAGLLILAARPGLIGHINCEGKAYIE